MENGISLIAEPSAEARALAERIVNVWNEMWDEPEGRPRDPDKLAYLIGGKLIEAFAAERVRVAREEERHLCAVKASRGEGGERELWEDLFNAD